MPDPDAFPTGAPAMGRRELVAGSAGIAVGLAAGAAMFSREAAAQPLPGASVSMSVRDFGARGDGRANDAPAIRAAIAAAREADHQEKRVLFPAGIYNVDTIDLTGTRGIVFIAEGTVQLVGAGSGDFILGARRDARNGGDGSAYNFRMEGGQFLIAPAPGARYRHAMQLHGFVQSNLNSVSVSGEFGLGEFERVAVTIDRSWINLFNGLAVACPGRPAGGGRTIAIRCEEDNVNANTFAGCRIKGVEGEAGAANSIGLVLTGTANRVANCDISAVATAIELKAARGCTLSDNYHELTQRTVVARTGNSCGCVITGGYYEVGPQTIALSLGSSESTTVIGGYFRGSGGGVFVDRGSACYGLTVIEPVLRDIAVAYTGIERGAAAPGAAATRVSAGGIVFPDVAVPSDHRRTLDDYEEGRFLPQGNGFVFKDGSASFTKIGNVVHLRFRMAFPISGSQEEAALIGLPVLADPGEGGGVMLGEQRNPDGNAITIRGDRLVVIDPRTGRARTNAEVSGQIYSGVATYAASGPVRPG